ncbi:MAG: hypothetical protein P4L67_04705 [Candidatus Pacebacteria bacterium]|nr:hypothetical protein [Candidatus Paceibacterota bacterium]
MVELDKLKPGDRVVTLYADTFCPANGDWFDVPAGSAFALAKPAVDWVDQCVRVAHEKAPSGAFLIDKSLLRMADLGEEPVETPKSCTCDMRGPNMWFGCRCGFAARERAEKGGS